MMNLSRPKEELAFLLEEQERRQKYNKLKYAFPDSGPYRRELYSKQLEFFKAGFQYRQRAMIAANRTGKSFAGGYEMALHATGRYPDWWEGRRFDKPVNCWAVGVSNIQTKEVVQHILMGDFIDPGSGLIPKDHIDPKRVSRPGVPEAIDTLRIKHYTDGVFDGMSTIVFKSYEQEREKFQGQAVHIIWLDEEPKNPGIYSECLTRIATTDGMLYCTFTPLLGISDVVLSFMPGGKLPKDGVVVNPETGKKSRKYIVQIDWEQVPHITEDMKEEMLSSYSPFERDARSKGIPQLGSGAIYPILEEDITCESFDIPPHWPRVYGLDVGWNKTAAVWAAIDPNDGVVYLYSELYQGKQELPVLYDGIKSRGQWIPGAVDPAADKYVNPTDGVSLYTYYCDAGLELVKANNAVEAGIYKVWNMLSSGRMKVFSNLQNWLGEFRIYRRNEDGKIVKKDDHLMDATRYLVMSGLDIAIDEREASEEYSQLEDPHSIAARKFSAGASETTGY